MGGVGLGARATGGRLFLVAVMVGAPYVLGSWAPAPVGAQPPAERASTAPPVSPIPMTDIARQAEAVTAQLRRRAEQLAASPEILAVESRLPAVGEDIDRRLGGTSQALASSPSPSALAMLADSWRVTCADLAAQSDVLTRRARVLERELEQTEAMRLTWTASREEALGSQAPAPVLERIETTLAALAATRRSVEAQRAWILGLQDRLVKEIGRCDDALARIAQAETALITPPFARDSVPIWSPEARVLIRPDHLGQRLRESVAEHLDLIRHFYASQLPRLTLQIAVFFIALVLARLARARAPSPAETGPSEAAAAQVSEMPVSAALVAALVSTIWIYPQPPRVVLNAVGVAVLLPAVRIVRRLAPPAMGPTVYAVAAFFLIDRLRETCSFVPALERWGFLLQMLLGIVFLALAIHSEILVIATSGREAAGWRRALTWFLWGQLAILAIALSTGALGYMRVARLLGGQALTSTYVALVLYAAVPVGEGLVAYALRTPLLRRLLAVARHRDLLQRRIHLILRWFAVGVWIYLTLDGVGLLWPLWSATHTVLDARYVRGSISISPGDVLAFALTIWAAFLLSSFARFVLREDVYPRVGLARGPAYAVSSLIHYAIVAVSVVLAIAALGLDLSRITILAGAFGLGAGIGLQGAVANFVSGLILLLEGRIRVGDSVQIDSLEGEVRDIGSRASTIRTWDGAEVIVPNGRMTSENVTNWTLSDRSHRVDVRVAVTYASDHERVLKILGGVATAHPRVHAAPAPRALCTGFGDSGMTFELRAWISYEEFLEVRSELAVAVHAALTAAGIEIAVPERHIHIRNSEGELRGKPVQNPEEGSVRAHPP